MFIEFYNFVLDTLAQLGTSTGEIYEWLTLERTLGVYTFTIVEVIIGSGIFLVLAFLLAKIVISLVS